MKIKFKKVSTISSYIFIGIVVIHLGLYLRFLYVMNYWGWIKIDQINPIINESEDWTWLPWMEKYCIDEWVEKSDISCMKKNIK